MISIANCKPVSDRVLLRRVTPPSGDDSIVIPDFYQEPWHRGVVIRVGSGRKFADGSKRPVDLKEGDTVRYMSCDYDDGEFILIQEGDVLGIERS